MSILDINRSRDKFIEDLKEVCKKHDVRIEQDEDGYGAFVSTQFNAAGFGWYVVLEDILPPESKSNDHIRSTRTAD